MPLTNPTIIGLNEITTLVEDKTRLSESEVDEIRGIFKDLVERGERYDVDEIEYWFENEGSWRAKGPRIRIANLASYIQDKHMQTASLRIVSDDGDGCCGGDGDGGSCGDDTGR